MKYIYKIKETEKIKEFDIYDLLDLAVENMIWVYDILDFSTFLENEFLDIHDNKVNDFIVFDTETRELKKMKISLDLVILEEKLMGTE